MTEGDDVGAGYWEEQVQAVMERLDRIVHRVEALDEKVDQYITNHDDWCAGLSVAVRGAAEVLQRIERYGGFIPDGDAVDVRGSRDTGPEVGPARSR